MGELKEEGMAGATVPYAGYMQDCLMPMAQRLELTAHFRSDITLFFFLIQATAYDVTSSMMYFSPSW